MEFLGKENIPKHLIEIINENTRIIVNKNKALKEKNEIFLNNKEEKEEELFQINKKIENCNEEIKINEEQFFKESIIFLKEYAKDTRLDSVFFPPVQNPNFRDYIIKECKLLDNIIAEIIGSGSEKKIILSKPEVESPKPLKKA